MWDINLSWETANIKRIDVAFIREHYAEFYTKAAVFGLVISLLLRKQRQGRCIDLALFTVPVVFPFDTICVLSVFLMRKLCLKQINLT